ncbi:transcription factor bHLH118 [Daucus carota subsp. sativus]|uniref:transcription factor bHLH118 n=1 Tax=Daucus carota subsp. sativus TaxID=79200 RepID=UPI0007F01438|nr:PREDICTED: transcription factor bHLH118-like isoform X2 [Daucus carota subsp. sativus]
MFSLKQGDELVFQIQTNNPNPDQQSIQQDLALSQASPQGGNKRLRKKPSSFGEDTSKDDERSKKIMHREIERQRRQEMGQLHGSLRSLLPLEFIKGKRSISDHMQQSVNYINHLQRSIRELNIKRDRLHKIPNYTTVISQGSGSSDFRLPSNFDNDVSVTVSPCLCGVEIIITSGFMEEQFPLSKVMQVLIQDEQLSVSTCASTRVNERLLHTIRAEAIDPMSINICELQWKLYDVLYG